MNLIINADDYGLTVNVSKGIIEGMKKGIISDTSAIVSTTDFPESAKMALENDICEMGLHCLLTMGQPILPVSECKSLVNEKGYFYSREEFKHREVNIDEVRRELEAQIERFTSTGLKLNHLDTHHGFMNKSEEMTKLFIELAIKYDVPLRNEASRKGDKRLMSYYKEAKILQTNHLFFNTKLPYHTVEEIIEYLEIALETCGVVEIGCHPGYCDELLKRISVLNSDREKELKVFENQSLINFIRKENITLLSYSDFKKWNGKKEKYEEDIISCR